MPARSRAFLPLFALAWAGGTIGWLPLLSVLLPLRIQAIEPDDRIGLVAAVALGGAVAASLSNLLFGWLSDRSLARGAGRRRWAAGGLAATLLSLPLVAAATTPAGLIGAILLFQLALNALLSPLVAIMADEVPDERKGLAGGLMALASPMAALVAMAAVGFEAPGEQLAIVAAAVAVTVVPLLFTAALPPVEAPAAAAGGDLATAWTARLLVQIAGGMLSYYLLYYVASLGPASAAGLGADVSRLLLFGYLLPLPVAALLGRLSDRLGSRRPFLAGTALAAAAGLLTMALATGRAGGAAGFLLYSVGAQSFLVLHAAFFMLLLPRPAHRGRDLGVLNLANTIPAIIGPLLAWALATPQDFRVLMLLLALLAAAGALLSLRIRGLR